MKITVSRGGRRGKRLPSRRVYVKLYEMVGDGKRSVTSASFTVYGATVKWLEQKIRGVVEDRDDYEPTNSPLSTTRNSMDVGGLYSTDLGTTAD